MVVPSNLCHPERSEGSRHCAKGLGPVREADIRVRAPTLSLGPRCIVRLITRRQSDEHPMSDVQAKRLGGTALPHDAWTECPRSGVCEAASSDKPKPIPPLESQSGSA